MPIFLLEYQRYGHWQQRGSFSAYWCRYRRYISDRDTAYISFYLNCNSPWLVPRLAREVFGPPLQSPACKASILEEVAWFPRNTVWDTTPWRHAALGTVVNTLAWGLFLRDHPWNIVRDCLFSFVYVFSSNLDRFSKKPMQDRRTCTLTWLKSCLLVDLRDISFIKLY